MKVLLLDADDEFAVQGQDRDQQLPAHAGGAQQYDVIILGDCDPNHKKLKNGLKDIVSFVRGEDEKGVKAAKAGGGLLFIAGASNNPTNTRERPSPTSSPWSPS